MKKYNYLLNSNMFTKDSYNIGLIYESMNSVSFLVERKNGERVRSIIVPPQIAAALDVLNTSEHGGRMMFQRFYRNDPNIANRNFSFQTYDQNEVKYLKDEENGDVWMNDPGDLKEILHAITTFGFDYNDLKDYFPKLTENDYNWLQSLG